MPEETATSNNGWREIAAAADKEIKSLRDFIEVRENEFRLSARIENAERAQSAAIAAKHEDRFRYIEQLCAAALQGITLPGLSVLSQIQNIARGSREDIPAAMHVVNKQRAFLAAALEYAEAKKKIEPEAEAYKNTLKELQEAMKKHA